jgi:hypothetical protein
MSFAIHKRNFIKYFLMILEYLSNIFRRESNFVLIKGTDLKISQYLVITMLLQKYINM